jgi:hypothetical protein
MDGLQPDPAMRRMQSLIDQWEAADDHRLIFLRCYRLMTGNMLAAIDQQEFHDSPWVGKLLHGFADYYFNALEAYEADHAIQERGVGIPNHSDPSRPIATPLVWQQVHDAASQPGTLALQNLLLGVNAHINYDLVLALVDILETEWDGLTESQRTLRYEDHCHVNRVIGMTVDAVQDQVLEPAMPIMDIFDKLMGPVDELLISRLLAHWRESVWHKAVRLLEAREPGKRAPLVKQYEADVLELGEIIQLRGFHPQRQDS